MSDRSCVISWSRPERWIWIVALTALSVVKTGYYVFYDNHATQLPLVYQLQNPQLFPQDPFLGAMQGYMGWVWILVAKLSQAVSIELVLGLLFLLTRVLLIYSAARLGSVLVPTSKAAPFMAALLMALGPYPILGDGTLVEVYWEQSSMFMPLFVLTLALLLEGKPARFFLLFGIAYLVNPLYGSWSALFFLVTYLVDPDRAPWTRYLVASPLFVALSAPIALGGVGVLSQADVDMDLWMWVNRLLISPHAFPETWPADLFWRFLLFSALVVLAGWIYRGWGARLGRLTLAWTGLAWVFLALAFPAAAGLSRTLLVFQPARAAELLYLAGGVAVASVGAYLTEKSSSRAGLALLVAWYSSLMYLLVPEFREYAAVSSLFLGVILVALLLAIEQSKAIDRRRWVTIAVVWLLFACGLTLAASVARRAKHEGGLARAMYRLPIPDMAELASWSRANTEVDAVFFHDPVNWEWAQFRYLAERPVFTTWKDASAVLWDPGFAEEWERRFAAFGFEGDLRDRWDLSRHGETKRIRKALMSHYRDMKDRDLLALAETYRIDYWIAPVETPSSFRQVATAGRFKILDIR